MTAATLTLTDFLLARIAEDEADALAATPRAWDASEITQVGTVWNAIHIARHDPARVLAECAAKRAIVEGEPARIATERQSQWHRSLRDLAAIYADHPDYDESWRP